MVSFEKVGSSLPRFDGAGDLALDSPKKKVPAQTIETMGNLEKDLLKTQLHDLDNWITKVRDLELREGGGRPLPPPVDEEDLAPPGVESLLRAQVQELEGWLIEARTPQRQDPEPRSKLTETDDELLLALRRERNWSVRRAVKPKDETAQAQQRLESAFEALRHMKDAETQRELALQQTRSVGLRTTEDFQRLFGQLHELEADPMRAPDLARYSITDVALALVNAIEQRRALATSLEAALVAQDRVRLGAEAHEQLLSCAAAHPVILRHADSAGVEHPEVMYAPAGQLTLNHGPLGDDIVDTQDLQVARIHRLAEKNRDLWEQLYGHWDAGARGRGLGGRASPSTLAFSDQSLGGALKSELKTLRRNEGRLDALLGPDSNNDSLETLRNATRGGDPRLNMSGAVANLPSLHSFVEREEELARTMKPARVAGTGTLDLGPFTTLTMEQITKAWAETAHKLTEWRRSRREIACERFLSRRVSAKALRWWLGGIVYEVAHAMPKTVPRGTKVRDVSNNNVGIFLSATPKGICKIQWAPNDFSLRPLSMLVWLRDWPHPAFGGLFFLAWARILVVREKQQVARFRSKVKGTRDETKTSNMLVWLSVQADSETARLRLLFESWHKLVADMTSANKDLLADVWMVWRHGALNNRHSRAVVALESTSSELRSARLTLLRQTQRFERLEQKLLKIDDLQNSLFLSYVIASWHYAIQMGRMRQAVAMQGRDERLKLALNLSQKLDAQLQSRMLPAIFNAWQLRVRNRNQAGKQRAALTTAFTQASLSTAFHEWKGLVASHHTQSAEQKVTVLNTRLAEKEEEFNRLQVITDELYGFSKEADVRVKQLEAALQAADKAIEKGTLHGGFLEKEVSSLDTQLRALESRVRQGEQWGQELKLEREKASNLNVELATTKGEKESMRNEVDIMKQRLDKLSHDLETEKRQVAALDAERAITQNSLEVARSEALEWKIKYEDEAGGFGDGVGDLSDESDILEALEEDDDGRLTKKGKKDLKKAVKAGKISEEAAAARMQGTYKSGGRREDPAKTAAKERVWVPDGEYLPPWSACMQIDKARDVVDHGADIMKRTPGTVFNKNEQFFFVVFEDSEDKFLCYYKNADERSSGVARGAFTLKDVTTGEWNGRDRELKLYQSGRRDGSPRFLVNVPNAFFEALLVVTREAEYRRVHHIFHGAVDAVRLGLSAGKLKGAAGRDGDADDLDVMGTGTDTGKGTGLVLPTPMTPSKDPKREAQRQKRKEQAEKAIADRLTEGVG